ncbi:MAG TPA: DUF4399 domain-containing protein [Gammaproteobacteria bacterium]|jgi:hypothetical protein|nr:DUF4399 domain-containing protein [Gammaproteobacteria bacterium]HIK72661.1 DUF4399 domain-containing protein [Gammaproteobacteria bacterium]
MKQLFSLCFLVLSFSIVADEPYVYFIEPVNGSEVKSPVRVVFGLSGMGIAPAGVDRTNTGHHHLLIDVEEMPDFKKSIPSDESHLHFGRGQTEALIKLTPGNHDLQLILGDRFHVPHDSPLISKKITVTVKK